MKRIAALLALAASQLAGAVSAPAVHAQTTDGPAVEADTTEFAADTPVRLSITGFTGNIVTVTACGNEGRRGSPDCNVGGSKTVEIKDPFVPRVLSMPIPAPPVPCPCIIRVSSPSNDQFAVLPVKIVGHPVAPLSERADRNADVAVTVRARPAPASFLDRVRAGLGGPARYAVTVRVRNTSTDTLDRLVVAASAGRNDNEDLVVLQLDDPSSVPPGQTWDQTVIARLPSLVFGNVTWGASVSGAGPVVRGSAETSRSGLLLFALVVLLLVDLAVIIGRAVARRRRRARDAATTAPPAAPIPDTVVVEREPELVG